MRRFAIPTLAVSLLVLVVPSAPAPAADARPTCARSAPTLTVDAADPALVTGTDGSDVILVTGGAHEVRALGGNDAVCVVGGTVIGVDLGDGDDELALVNAPVAADQAPLVGGAGRDLLAPLYSTAVDIDMPGGGLYVATHDTVTRYALSGFEDARVATGHATIVGDDGPNNLVVYACRATVIANGGSDVVRFGSKPYLGAKPDPTCGRRNKLYAKGGAGRDRLIGRRWADVLIGGPGRDVADGRGGGDVCRAEVERRCG